MVYYLFSMPGFIKKQVLWRSYIRRPFPEFALRLFVGKGIFPFCHDNCGNTVADQVGNGAPCRHEAVDREYQGKSGIEVLLRHDFHGSKGCCQHDEGASRYACRAFGCDEEYAEQGKLLP